MNSSLLLCRSVQVLFLLPKQNGIGISHYRTDEEEAEECVLQKPESWLMRNKRLFLYLQLTGKFTIASFKNTLIKE